MHSTTSAVDFSKETLVVKEEETYDAGAFERVEAEVVKLLKEPQFFLIKEQCNRAALILSYRLMGFFQLASGSP